MLARLAIAICILVLLYKCDAQAIEMVGDKISLTAGDRETLKSCSTDNPCTVWSLDEVRVLLTVYRERLISDGSTCRRNMT